MSEGAVLTPDTAPALMDTAPALMDTAFLGGGDPPDVGLTTAADRAGDAPPARPTRPTHAEGSASAGRVEVSRARVVKAATVAMQRTGDAPPPPPPPPPTCGLTDEELAEQLERAYEEGRRAGLAVVEAELAAALEQAAAAVERSAAAVADAVLRRRQEDARELTELALEVTGWALRHELSGPTIAFFARLAELLAECEDADAVTLFVAPQLEAVVAGRVAGAGIEVRANPALEPGEAELRAGDLRITSTFAEALLRARQALLDEPEPKAAS